MLDIGWSELLVIGIVALLVVGPKELPSLLRTVGQWVGRARGMAREFQKSMEDAAREADLDKVTDLKSSFDDLRKMDFKTQANRAQSFLDPGSDPETDTHPDDAKAAPRPSNPTVATAKAPADPATSSTARTKASSGTDTPAAPAAKLAAE